MVGQTARTMQGTGWLPITPVGCEIPSWLGLWFGIFPTWRRSLAQVAAAVRDRLLLGGDRAPGQAPAAPRPREKAEPAEPVEPQQTTVGV